MPSPQPRRGLGRAVAFFNAMRRLEARPHDRLLQIRLLHAESLIQNRNQRAAFRSRLTFTELAALRAMEKKRDKSAA